MSDTYYYYFQCLNAECGRSVVVDVRIKDGDKAFVAMACPLCAVPMDYGGCASADADGYAVKWETVVDDPSQSVRRLVVPTGWIYQMQDSGGRIDDPAPIWGSMVFVPKKAL